MVKSRATKVLNRLHANGFGESALATALTEKEKGQPEKFQLLIRRSLNHLTSGNLLSTEQYEVLGIIQEEHPEILAPWKEALAALKTESEKVIGHYNK